MNKLGEGEFRKKGNQQKKNIILKKKKRIESKKIIFFSYNNNLMNMNITKNVLLVGVAKQYAQPVMFDRNHPIQDYE